MKKTTSKLISVLLAFSMIASMLVTTAFAQSDSVALKFVFPEETYGETPVVTVDVYKGYLTSSSGTAESGVKNGQLTEAQLNVGTSGCTVTAPGTYTYNVYGKGDGDYYPVIKMFNVTDADFTAGEKTITLEGGKCGTENGDGYEPGYMPSLAPDTYTPDARGLLNWTDEILEHFKVQDQGYETPAFDGKHAANEFTSQEELMEFVENRVATCDYMYQYSAGTTGYYDFDLPMVLVTTTPIPQGATIEEAAEAMTSDGKVNVWYQSQIHPNEPASGEASLVMLNNFAEKDEYKKMLETVNVIVVPRINPDGSYLFSRATTAGFDMNRDHLSLKAVELAQLHTAWNLFKTEVVVDTHEFTYYGASNGQMSNADDIQTTPASSLNADPDVNAYALKMAAAVFAAEQNSQEKVGEGYDPIRVNHYGYTVNAPIGRCYFGLLDCLSFLIETRGIGAGRNNLERRVLSQEIAATTYIKYAAEHAQEIKELVAEAREKLVAQGKIYSQKNVFALKQSASGNTLTPYTTTSYTYKLDGTEVIKAENKALSMNDTATNARVRPTAYVIPADAENIEQILYILENQGAEYYKLSPGSTANLQQYYFINKTGSNSCVAGLRNAEKVMLKHGAYVFPMDQLAANVIASILELDTTDSNGYDGTLYQYKYDGVNPTMDYDKETMNFPLYRYTGNNPRTTLVSNASGVIFDLPAETYGEDADVNISFYKNYPTSTSVSASWLSSNLLYEDVADTGCPMPETPGFYSYYVNTEGYYKLLKVLYLDEDAIKEGSLFLEVEGGKYKGTGYEPTITPADAPATYKQDSRDATLINWPDQVLENAFSVEPQGYKTPAFTWEHAAHELTSQENMELYVQGVVDRCDNMYLYSAGKSPALGFNLPLVVITKSEIPAGATLEEAAKIVTANGKTNVWYQSQIHPNEPASGEASLVMLDHFADDDEYIDMLDDINVILIPRINPEGSYLYSRTTYGGFDMNRDHTSLKAAELAQLHTAWNLFKTEVVVDTHEFNWYGARNDTVYDADDIETTPATSLNHSPALTEVALEMAGEVFEAERAAGIRVDHYQGDGWTVNPPIGRCYFGLLDCLSFLIETRGIGAGMNGMERRVRSQEVAVSTYLAYTAEHAKEIKDLVATERAKLIKSGKTYDENNLFALQQSASGKKVTPYLSTSYAVDMKTGEWIPTQENWALALNDTIERSRPRPTAYVVPADHPNIDKILYILDNQSAERYMLAPGTVANLQQYYYAESKVTYPYPDYPTYSVKVDIAGLRNSADVTFANGAYVFPMDQLAANVIASIFEPDMTDSSGYDGSLFQYKADGVNPVMDYDKETMNFPLYRYIGDNPRETLIGNAAVEVVPARSTDGVNTMKFNVNLSSEEGIGAAVIALSNDPALELIAVKGVDWTKGDKNLVVNEDIQPDAVKSIELTFKVVGDIKNCTVTAKLVNACTMNEKDLSGAASSAKGYIIGDANGDGKVAASDLVRLRNYIGLNGEGVEIFLGGDINGDTLYNTIDLTALNRYFANADF